MDTEKRQLYQEIRRLERENSYLKKQLETSIKKQIKLKHKLGENQAYLQHKIEEKFRLTMETTPLPILISSLKTHQIIYANKASCGTFQISRKNLINFHQTDIYYDQLEGENLLKKFQEDGYIDGYETKCKKANGNCFFALVSMRQFKYQGKLAVLTIINDISELKRLENERNRFFELSLDLFCIASFEGYFLQVNSAWEKLLGYTQEELKSTQFFDFIHPEDQEKTISELKKIEQGNNIFNFENRYRCKDGSYRWLLWSSIPIFEEGVTYAVAHDITERKQIEEKLYKSREELRLITDSLPIGISYVDNQRRYCFVNHTHELWFNHKKEEIIGKYLWETLGEDFYHKEAIFLVNRVLQGEDVSFETMITLNDQKSGHIDGRLVPDFDKNGQVKGYFCIIIDITQRKQAELKIQEQLQTIEATIDGIAIFKEEKLIYLNQATLTMFRYETKKDLLGKNWLIFYTDLESERLKNEIFLFLKKYKSWQGETVGIKKDTSIFDVEVSLTLLENNTIIAIFRDISDRKQVEQSLRIAEENYRSIFENSLQGIFQSTPQGYYLNLNSAMAKIHGYDSPDEMIANVKHINQQIYVNPQVREEFQLLLEKQDYIQDFEYEVHRRDGKIIWLQENTRAVRDNYGQLLYYEGIIQDITERKLKEKMLQKQIEELRISIDQNKRQQEVNSILESEYFQELKANLNQLRINS